MSFHGPLAFALICLGLLPAGPAAAQSPRTRSFTSSHDFISDADLTRGVVVVQPGSDSKRAPARRLSAEDSSLRLPLAADEGSLPNLVRPNVTVDSAFPGYTSAAITDGKQIGFLGQPGRLWVSDVRVYEQHWVDLEFSGGPRIVNQVQVVWGVCQPVRFKVQIAGARGWLEDATGWLDASGGGLTVIPLGSVSTTRVRIVQDVGSGGSATVIPAGPSGTPCQNVMTVDELTVFLGFGPVLAHPVSVDSSYLDYVTSLIADGDTREGTTADFWTETWVSADTPAPHWVEARLEKARSLAQAEIYWGHWGSARFKVQYWNGASFVDTSTSAMGWLEGGGGQAVSRVGFEPVTTTRLRVLQDANGGAPPSGDTRVGLMSVAELRVRPGQTFARSAVQASADSSYPGYIPGAAFDGVRPNPCLPSECDGPGLLWVSAETPVDHWLELRLGHLMYVGNLTVDWGAWGSTAWALQYWNGSAWITASTHTATSNQSATHPFGVWTDRLRLFQAAGAGSGRPDDGLPLRTNLMSIREILIEGYRATGTYVSAPTRLDDPLAQVTLFANASNTAPPQSVAYAVSSDDGESWTPVTPGVPTATPPGKLVRWRASLSSAGSVSPEILDVELAMTGVPTDIGAALWRGARSGAASVGVDDSFTELGKPGEPLLSAGYFGAYFLWTNIAPYHMMRDGGYTWEGFLALGHELGSHTESHGCTSSPPDGFAGNNLTGEFDRQTGDIDALYAQRGRVQALAWPCGNYDLSKGSVAQRYFVSARGFRHGDPNGDGSCNNPGQWECALPGGEPQELLEEPTPRNFMNLRAIAADAFRSPSGALPDVRATLPWAQNEGNWLNLAYHYFAPPTVPYSGEIAEMAAHDLWVAPQGEVARYIKLRDSIETLSATATPTTRDFRIRTALTNDDVPLWNHARGAHPVGEWVERVFFGGVTARVWSPPVRGTPYRIRVWNNGVDFRGSEPSDPPIEIEGNPYLVFETPLVRAATPVRVEWLDTPNADDDGDSVPNRLDNCRYAANAGQADQAGVGTATSNQVGNACECGDLSDDGSVDPADVDQLRAWLVDPAGNPLSAAGLAKCSVHDSGSAGCDVVDLVVLRRRLSQPPLLPGVADACPSALPN